MRYRRCKAQQYLALSSAQRGRCPAISSTGKSVLPLQGFHCESCPNGPPHRNLGHSNKPDRPEPGSSGPAQRALSAGSSDPQAPACRQAFAGPPGTSDTGKLTRGFSLSDGFLLRCRSALIYCLGNQPVSTAPPLTLTISPVIKPA